MLPSRVRAHQRRVWSAGVGGGDAPSTTLERCSLPGDPLEPPLRVGSRFQFQEMRRASGRRITL